MWGSHNHFVEVKYMIGGPLGRTLFILAHPYALRPIATTQPTYVFLSFINDTHIIGPTSDVVFTFL